MSSSVMSCFKLFNLLIVIYLLKCHQIHCDQQKFAGESKKVLNILKDLQTDASHPLPSHHYDSHNSGHDHWDNFDKLWENGGGSHNSEYDKYGNHGYKQHYMDVHKGFHDKHNDGLRTGNYEEYDDKSLWSRDRGNERHKDLSWDRELAIKKAHAANSGHLTKYRNMDNGAHYGNRQFDENNFDNYGGRGRHSGHGWHELDRVRHLNGGYNHGSVYREAKQPFYPPPHEYH